MLVYPMWNRSPKRCFETCSHCFHPDLISGALGSNTCLKLWAKGEVEGSNKLVMNQAEAYAVFSELCEQIEKESKKTAVQEAPTR